MEEFRDIPGYEGLYKIQIKGKTKNLGRFVCETTAMIAYQQKLLSFLGSHQDNTEI